MVKRLTRREEKAYNFAEETAGQYCVFYAVREHLRFNLFDLWKESHNKRIADKTTIFEMLEIDVREIAAKFNFVVIEEFLNTDREREEEIIISTESIMISKSTIDNFIERIRELYPSFIIEFDFLVRFDTLWLKLYAMRFTEAKKKLWREYRLKGYINDREIRSMVLGYIQNKGFR